LELGLRVTDNLEDVCTSGAELGVVVAYGRIIPARILDMVPMLNVHFSLLPRWRGAAPVERAILAGDPTTGICVMRLEAGLDTGPVLARLETPISDVETSVELMGRLAVSGAELLAKVLSVDGGVSALASGEVQVGEPTYASKIEPSELELHFGSPAVELARIVRIGKAWTKFRGSRLIVSKAVAGGAATEAPPGTIEGTTVATGDGTLELIEVQPEGRKRTTAGEWVRGARPEPGERLGK
jgi:methionyl-tRNA formyltransferase